MTDPTSRVDHADGMANDLTDAALDRWVADAEAKAEQYRALSVGVGQVSVTETSPDGLITVTVNSGGVLTDLKISERALPGPRTASIVLATMHRAQARIVTQVADIMRSTIGDDPAMVDAIMADYRGKFPEPVEPPRQQSSIRPDGPARPRPVARRGQGWDDGNGSVMEEVDR